MSTAHSAIAQYARCSASWSATPAIICRSCRPSSTKTSPLKNHAIMRQTSRAWRRLSGDSPFTSWPPAHSPEATTARMPETCSASATR